MATQSGIGAELGESPGRGSEAVKWRQLIRRPAKLTGPRHELCTWGEPIRPVVGSLRRKHYTQYVEQNRKGHPWVLRHAQSLDNRLAATANTRETSEHWKGTNNGGDTVS
jgi:hypothetical protein